MLIAFEIYGNYLKWKDLRDMNSLHDMRGLKEGMVLKYKKPRSQFSWKPQGLPHLVREGETLGSISLDKYKTTQKWRLIYENNKPLIKDYNLIFAGFTLYYIPLRDLASH